MLTHEEAKPSLEIQLDAGGDHQFNLGHLKREGAGRLIRLLLQTAGYRRALRWKVRVEKKFGCGPETRPVTVVGAKRWCCYLKIKPGDNNTAHFCSLLMPDGLRGEAVYEDLKEVEGRVCSAWKRGFEGEVAPMEENVQAKPAAAEEPPPPPQQSEFVEEAAPPPPPLPEEEEEEEETPPPPQLSQTEALEASAPPLAAAEVTSESSSAPEVSELLGFSADPDKVRLTLLAIHEVCEEAKSRTLDEFVAALVPKMGWQSLKRKQIGGLFTALVRRQLIARVNRGSMPVSYELTGDGRKFIEDLLPAPKAPAAASVAARPSVAPSTPASAPARPSQQPADVSALFGLIERLNRDARRHSELVARRAELQTELDAIDVELRDLNRYVNNPEIQELIRRLISATGQLS